MLKNKNIPSSAVKVWVVKMKNLTTFQSYRYITLCVLGTLAFSYSKAG